MIAIKKLHVTGKHPECKYSGHTPRDQDAHPIRCKHCGIKIEYQPQSKSWISTRWGRWPI